MIEDLLKEYNLPTKISLKGIPFNKNNLQNSIYKNIFLDKKELIKILDLYRFLDYKNLRSKK